MGHQMEIGQVICYWSGGISGQVICYWSGGMPGQVI